MTDQYQACCLFDNLYEYYWLIMVGEFVDNKEANHKCMGKSSWQMFDTRPVLFQGHQLSSEGHQLLIGRTYGMLSLYYDSKRFYSFVEVNLNLIKVEMN